MANIREISGNTIGNNVTIVQGDLNTANPSSSESINYFLNKVSKTDPFYDKKRILELKGPLLHESFNWILDHEGFKKWRHTKESSVLWIKGDPGKGKTMLLCGIIEDLKKIPGENSNLGYFFCQATDSRINSASSVVAGLIFSLVKQNPAFFSPICKKHEDKLSQLDGPNAWAVLGDIFEAITQVRGISNPICVVDALDECEHDCKLLLRLIIKTSSYVKWLLSSRNVKDIERELRAIEPARRLSLELKENAKMVSKSVDFYINNSISGIEALEKDEELQTKTVATLKRKSNGTYLWVALVIEQLRDTDHRNIEEVLEETPEGLENLYDLIVQRANAKLRQKDREACRILLSIVTTAERPLHLEELHTFISSQWARYKSSYNILDMKDVVRDCGSLLAISDNIIYFIHQSVKDYIVGNAYSSIFPSGIQYQHQKMFETSMTAMFRILKHNIYNLKDPQSRMGDITHRGDIKPSDPDPLVPIKYSCVFWVDHLIRGYDSEEFKSEECFKGDGLLQTFLKAKYLCWLEALALLRCLTPEGGSALQRLKGQAERHCRSKANGRQVSAMTSSQNENTNFLMNLISDAYRFFHYCQDFVRKWPLQLYYSATIFEDKCSAIYKSYQQSTRSHVGDFITVIRKPQRRCSLQHNINTMSSVTKLLYSPDSSTLCVSYGLWDGTLLHWGGISLYRTDTECTIRLSVDEEHRYYVSFLPDSRHLVSVSSIGIVQTWAIDTGIQVQQLSLNLDMRKLYPEYHTEFFREEVINLSLHGDLAASIFCTSCNYSGKYLSSMNVWTTKTGVCVCQIDLMHTPSYQSLYDFAPNSALMAIINRSDAIIYSVWTGKMVKHIRVSGFIEHSRFSQDSALFAFTHNWSAIELWCTESWTMVRQIEFVDNIHVFDLSFDASMFVAYSNKSLVFGSTRTGEQLFRIAIGNETKNISFSPDWPTSSLLAFASSNGVQIWRVDTRDSSAEMRSAYSPWSVVISPGSKYVAARSREGYINIWSGKSGECIQALKSGNSSLARPVFSPNLELIACSEGDRGDVRIWHLATGEPLHLLESHSGSCNTHTMVFSEDSKYLFTGYRNKEVRVWCAETGECLYKSDENNDDSNNDYHHEYPITIALAISPESKYTARASRWESKRGNHDVWEHEVRIWDWGAARDISSFDPNQARRENFLYIDGLAFSSDATILTVICQVSGTKYDQPEYETQIWEVATGTFITCVAVGESCSVPLFDPTTNKILTDRAGFCKGSSWEHWELFSWRAYSLWTPFWKMPWICFGGEKVLVFPEEFSPKHSSRDCVAISSSLLAYIASADEMMIIQLPSQHELERLGIIAFHSDNVGDSGLRTDGSNSEVVSYLATGKSDSDEPKGLDEAKDKRLKLSWLLE
ncbi:quinon protein alcohol dehydrogenase-like superfamily [Trichoderma sp. SZMC 28015]